MATPAAAGIALLIRQYFRDSKFWSSICAPRYSWCKPFDPSGALVKGILLHSTSPMELYHGGGSNNIKLGTPPDSLQGYGRVTLANVLPLPGFYSFDLFVEDQAKLQENSQISYALSVKKSDIPLV